MADMTPAAWLELLERRLDKRWSRMRILDEYFEGHHPLAFTTTKYREAFGALLQGMADNWCQIVVSASVQRLKVTGFRFGDEQKADKDAWHIWQANGLDAESKKVHEEAVKLGEAAWLIDPMQPVGDDVPRITAEHPSEVIVACDPGDRRRRLAALKRWRDDDGYGYANLYLPTYFHKYRSTGKLKPGQRIQWTRKPGDEGGPNPLGEVPVIPIRRCPSMLHGGRSAFEAGIPLQNAINKECNDMLVASEYAAYRQRVMTGVEQETNPVTGDKVPIELGVNRIFTVEDPAAKVYDLAASDLKNYVQAIEMFTQHFAAQTQTPPHYLMGQIVNASGDALTAAEAGLNSRTDDEKDSFSEGHEDAVRLAFLAMGDRKRAAAVSAETLWADSERRSFAQVVDGAGKLHEMGVPDEFVWEELGWSPQKIERAKAMKQVTDLLAAADAAQAAAAGGPSTNGAAVRAGV